MGGADAGEIILRQARPRIALDHAVGRTDAAGNAVGDVQQGLGPALVGAVVLKAVRPQHLRIGLTRHRGANETPSPPMLSVPPSR